MHVFSAAIPTVAMQWLLSTHPGDLCTKEKSVHVLLEGVLGHHRGFEETHADLP